MATNSDKVQLGFDFLRFMTAVATAHQQKFVDLTVHTAYVFLHEWDLSAEEILKAFERFSMERLAGFSFTETVERIVAALEGDAAGSRRFFQNIASVVFLSDETLEDQLQFMITMGRRLGLDDPTIKELQQRAMSQAIAIKRMGKALAEQVARGELN